MTKLHGQKWVPIRRSKPIDNRFAVNYGAEPEESVLIYGWEVIK